MTEEHDGAAPLAWVWEVEEVCGGWRCGYVVRNADGAVTHRWGSSTYDEPQPEPKPDGVGLPLEVEEFPG